MEHYSEAYEAEHEKYFKQRRLTAARTWNNIESLLKELNIHIYRHGRETDLAKALETFKDATIIWRYNEDLLEDTTEVILEKLSED